MSRRSERRRKKRLSKIVVVEFVSSHVGRHLGPARCCPAVDLVDLVLRSTVAAQDARMNQEPFTFTPFPPMSSSTSNSRAQWRPFSQGITSLTVDIPQPKPRASTSTRRKEPPAPAARWRSKEFCAYYAVFVVAVPCMAKAVIDLSRGAFGCAGRRRRPT